METILLLLLLMLFYFGGVLSSHPLDVMKELSSSNLDELFTYNHIALMSIRSRSRVKAYMVLVRADHLFIHNYIRHF